MRSHKLLIWILTLILLAMPVMGALPDNVFFYFKQDTATTNSTHIIDTIKTEAWGHNGLGISTPGLILEATNATAYKYANRGTAFDNNGNLTINFWVYRTGAGAGDGDCIGPASWTTGGIRIQCREHGVTGNYHLEANLYRSAGDDRLISGYEIPLNSWHMITFILDETNGNASLWINGTMKIAENHTEWKSGSTNWRIPITVHGWTTSASWLEGKIDEIGYWNRSLSQAEITQLWNSGAGLSYPFPGAGATTDIDFTAVDDWTGTSIQNFSINISWANGTTEAHTTTNGTVSLVDVGNPGTINVTFLNATNYFNLTLYSQAITANASNTVQAELYQAVLCLNASEKVSGDYITPNNFTIGTNVSSSCFNITAGTHNVKAQKTGWFSQNQTFTISALTNTTQTVQNMSYANLTVYAIDGNTNNSLSGYTLTINSITEPGWSGETTGAVTNHSFSLINGTYNVTIAMPGYATTYGQANVTVSGHTNHTFTLYLSNSVSITIRDEITNTPIYDDITIRWSDNTTTWENTTNTSSMFVSNITTGNYTLLFYSSNYSTRTYSVTVGPSSHQFLTAYIISSTYSTIFTIKDIDTGSILDGVAITMYKLINSTWTTVESKVSDISGKAQFYYDPIANYRFYLSASEYDDYIFYLNPILFSTYDVYMTKSSVLNYSVDFDDISFIYSPTTFNNNANTSLNFLISSPGGMLTNYGISVTYPGGNDSASGVNAIGEQLTVDVNVTNATAYDYVVLEFNYTTSVAGTRSYTFNLPINMNITAGTWLTNKDKTYGLGIFERLLIATIIIIFVVGIATMVGQAVPGVALGLFVYGFLVFIGFIPLWAILPSMLIGVLFLIWKSGGY